MLICFIKSLPFIFLFFHPSYVNSIIFLLSIISPVCLLCTTSSLLCNPMQSCNLCNFSVNPFISTHNPLHSFSSSVCYFPFIPLLPLPISSLMSVLLLFFLFHPCPLLPFHSIPALPLLIPTSRQKITAPVLGLAF